MCDTNSKVSRDSIVEAQKMTGLSGEETEKAGSPVESLRTRREGEPKKVFEKISQYSIRRRRRKKDKRTKGHMTILQVPVSSTAVEKVGRSLIIEILLNRQQGNFCLGYILYVKSSSG